MKKLYYYFLFVALLITAPAISQVAINTDGSTANPSAMLDIKSDTAGILIPRMTATQRDNIQNPANGLLVYVTDDSTFYYCTNNTWFPIGSTTANTLDEAYDQGGAGAGKSITADNGAVRVDGTDGLLVTGTFGSGNTIDNEITGAGTRMFFNPNKGAFRAGYVNSTQWDDANIGYRSFAAGEGAKASGGVSFAMGSNTVASGSHSTALGEATLASGFNSTALGYYATASGQYSFALGMFTTAPSQGEVVIGRSNTDYTPVGTDSWSISDRLFVIGNGTSSSNKSNALTIYKDGRMNINDEYYMPLTDGTAGQLMQTNGNDTVSWIDASTISNTLDEAYDQGGAGAGKNITADNGAVRVDGTDGFLVTGTVFSGNTIDNEVTGEGTRMFFNPYKAAFRAGYVNASQWDGINIGLYSVAMGYETKASGRYATALSYNTIASGDYSLSTGFGTLASGIVSTAIGNTTIASGKISTAMGLSTTAPSYVETSMGSNNTDYTPVSSTSWNTSDRLFVVGNGASPSAKHNALTIYKNGRININDEYFMPLTDGTAGQLMQTNGNDTVSWVNAPVSAAGSIDTHNDVDVSTNAPLVGQILSWNGAKWRPADDDVGVNNTLDQAYDEGGSGAGKNITADNGAVRINGTDGFLVTGAQGSGNTIDTEVTGYGTRMFFNPYKAAFRVGRVFNSNWDDVNVGNYSVAMGFGTLASGSNSTAIGMNSIASGDGSFAAGTGVSAPSYREVVLGSYNTTYTPADVTGWTDTDRLFVIGYGYDMNHRSDAIIVYKNGVALFDNKITAPVSGTDADLKPYIYGSLKDSDGSYYSTESTSGFTSTLESTGVYKITFDSYNSDKAYLVVANALRTSGPVILTYEKNYGYFRIRAWDLSGSLVNTYLNFVVYRK